MGILAEPARFVEGLIPRLPPGFAVAELGDQYVTHSDPHVLAAEWFARLGCGRYVSIDGNGRGTVTADLNRPLKDLGLADESFDLVTDFGTGEHIFHQAQVWKTLHMLVKPGGYIAFDRPIAGYPGHGYYLCDPVLFRDLAEANLYTVVQLARGKTSRGELVRGIFRRPAVNRSFKAPQQSRYQRDLVFLHTGATP